jgi:multicomponent Na+:H+ antiporter subunit D
MMINTVPPVAIFIVGALLIPFLKGRLQSVFLLALPVIGFINLINIPEGSHWVVSFLDYNLVLGKVDRLSLVFGYIYHIIAFIALLFALHLKDNLQHMAAVIYAGAALGIVFAGDLITLFIFWEVMAIAATYLIWARKTKLSYGAGLRYLLVHLFGGLCLLAGIIIHAHTTGSTEFGFMGLNGLGSWLIFIGFGINCAWPGLHPWLTDAYPETTATGAVFMWTFTTKTAIYVLARGFPGTELLIWIGAIMTVFPIFFAVIENNLRRVLSYSLINQLGFMVCGIGIGTQLSLNGTVSHAFCHILYKALLVMSMGAVLHRTGKINCTDLGGLYKSMPLTALFCMVGAASISAFPLFNGFVSKSMVFEAAALGGFVIPWFLLLFASVGVLEHAGIKVPYYAFFAHDRGIRTKEAPTNMLLAMGIAAFLCVFIGVFPGPLYSILPYPVVFEPYSASHVVTTCQLLFFGALAYVLLTLAGVFPSEKRALNLDADWFYRKGANALAWFVLNPVTGLVTRINRAVFDLLPSFLIWFGKNPPAALKISADMVVYNLTSRDEDARRLEKERAIYPRDLLYPWSIGAAVSFVLVFLLLYLVLYYWRGT